MSGGWVNPFAQPTREERRETAIATTAASLFDWMRDVISSVTDDALPPPMDPVVALDCARGVVLRQLERTNLFAKTPIPQDLMREVADRVAVLFAVHYLTEPAGRA
jgi:hypothetical protein